MCVGGNPKRNTKYEIRNPKEIRNSKYETRKFRISDFVFRISRCIFSPVHDYSLNKLSETQRKRSITQRMFCVHAILLIMALIITARLAELQIIKGIEYREIAQAQHYGGVRLPAKRGEILSRNSKTGETSIFATNTTLDMVYVDPLITDDPSKIAETLSDILITQEVYENCVNGHDLCPPAPI